MRPALKKGLIGAAVLATGVLFLGPWSSYNHAIRAWIAYDWPATKPSRWLRCRNEQRPTLKSAGTWTINYSWQGGMGPGDFRVRIESTGQATLSSKSNSDSQERSTERTLDSASISELAALVDDSGLLCQSPEPRVGYRVYDLGRFTLEVASGDKTKVVYIDGCHTLPDGKAFDQVTRFMLRHKEQLGEEVSWGPYATASVPVQCNE